MNDLSPRLIKGLHAEYTPAKWSGENESGIRAIGPHVIILCDECSEMTSGSIALPLDMQESMTLASEQGVIVAMGEAAFCLYEDGRPWLDEHKPKLGDRVYFEKYAGRLCRGIDGIRYRLMDYKCIAAIYEVVKRAA